MRDYGRVHGTFWSSPTIAPLPDDAKVLALYLLTCTHSTIAGVFPIPDGYASEDLRWTPERVREGFAELLANGFANRCEATKWVWIEKYLKWNPPDNPNQRKAAAKVALGVPAGCTWKPDFMRACGPQLGLEHNDGPNASETVGATLSKPVAVTVAVPVAVEGTPKARHARSARKATRLPTDWVLPQDWRALAAAKRPDLDVDAVAADFARYWRSEEPQQPAKRDWFRCWQTWVERERIPARAAQNRRSDSVLHADDSLSVLR